MSCSRGCCPDQLSHYRSISVAASACPSREGGRYAAHVNAKEKRWHKDHAAVRALKKDGIVPRRVDGCHDLVQQAETRVEIEAGTVLKTKKQREQLKAVMPDA